MSTVTVANVVEELELAIKSWANGAHIIVPKRWAGRRVKVLVLEEPQAWGGIPASDDPLASLAGRIRSKELTWEALEAIPDEEVTRAALDRE